MTRAPERIRTAVDGHCEDQLHRYVVELLRFTAKRGVLWYHCPNGGYRSKRTAAKLKAMGVLPGVADICLVINGCAHFLELKTVRGTQSAAQRAFAKAAAVASAAYAVVRTPEQAKTILEMWNALRSSSLSPARRVA